MTLQEEQDRMNRREDRRQFWADNGRICLWVLVWCFVFLWIGYQSDILLDFIHSHDGAK